MLGIAQGVEGALHHHAAYAFVAEQLLQHRAVDMATDEMSTRHTGFARAYRAGQEQADVVGQFVFAVGGQGGARLCHGELSEQFALFVLHAVCVHQEHQFVGIQRDGGGSGDVFQGDVEHFAGGRVTQRREQYDFAEFHAVVERGDIDLAHRTGVHQVHTVDDAYRLRGDEVAARHADVGIGHGRVRQTHRQQRLDLDTHAAHRFLHALHGLGIGHAYALMVAAADVVLGQMLLDLRPRAVYQHQA